MADLDIKSVVQPVQNVQIDGLVLLKIIKHCKEQAPDQASGQLLGLNVDGRLEVTQCFPMPVEGTDEDGADYQLEMMNLLRASFNVDSNTVGWYTSAFLGYFPDQAILEAQFYMQKEIPDSICIVHDPFRTTAGQLYIRAYRLSDRTMALMEKKIFSPTALAEHGVDSTNLFVEVPIKLHNSLLAQSYLFELREDPKLSCDADRLQISRNASLERTLSSLSATVEIETQQQTFLQAHLKSLQKQRMAQEAYLRERESENAARREAGKDPLPEEDRSKNPLFRPVPAPSRQDALLLGSQLSQYCEHLSRSAAQGLNKATLVQALHQD